MLQSIYIPTADEQALTLEAASQQVLMTEDQVVVDGHLTAAGQPVFHTVAADDIQTQDIIIQSADDHIGDTTVVMETGEAVAAAPV